MTAKAALPAFETGCAGETPLEADHRDREVDMSDAAIMTLAGAVADLGRRGCEELFAVAGEALRALGCDAMLSPEDVVIREYYRFEGISNPLGHGDRVALESPIGIRGVLVDAFGVYADPAIIAFVQEAAIRPSSNPLGG
jgi:hypothetical protein